MIKFLGDEQDQITFVTRAVRVVDLITNLDMAAFQSHSGLSIFICRLEVGYALSQHLTQHSKLESLEPAPKLWTHSPHSPSIFLCAA